MPEIRSFTEAYGPLLVDSRNDIMELLECEAHEVRLAGAIMLVGVVEKKGFRAGWELEDDDNGDGGGIGDEQKRYHKSVIDFYLRFKGGVNNWDIVDSSAHKIVGTYLLKYEIVGLRALMEELEIENRAIVESCSISSGSRTPSGIMSSPSSSEIAPLNIPTTSIETLEKHLPKWYTTLLTSNQFWDARIAIVGLLQLRKEKEMLPFLYTIVGYYLDCYKTRVWYIYERRFDDMDLLEKAMGWILRECGNQDMGRMVEFLRIHHFQMGRVCLSYATEKMKVKPGFLWNSKSNKEKAKKETEVLKKGCC